MMVCGLDKGFLFTAGVVLVVIPLILLVTYYSFVINSQNVLTVSSLRCDKVHFIVEDLKRDLERAMVIFGRRSAVYVIDRVVYDGVGLDDYIFNCTMACAIDCDDFAYPMNGSQAATAELVLCGTLHGENVTYMANHSLPMWLRLMDSFAASMDYNITITAKDFTVVLNDPFNFTSIVETDFLIKDANDMCSYSDTDVVIESVTSVIGLEDPLYPLHTDGYLIKYIINCEPELDLESIAGCSKSASGGGYATGTLVLYTYIGGNTNHLEDYCDNTDPIELATQLLVLDYSWLGC